MKSTKKKPLGGLSSKRANPHYRALINSSKWRKLRNSYLIKHPLCERCLLEHRSTLAVAVHHIEPLENHCDNRDEMERLAYDVGNLMSVCNTCHGLIHKELKTRTKEATLKRCEDEARQFIEKYLV